MEDISRELEREIAQIKPAPHKLRGENTILIINDFGEIRSGAFLKVLVCFFLVLSLAGGLGTVAFYTLYSKANYQKNQLKNTQDAFEKEVDRLTREKELLMARLVMTGNAGELKALALTGRIGQEPPKKEKRSGIQEKKERNESVATGTAPDSKIPKEALNGSGKNKPAVGQVQPDGPEEPVDDQQETDAESVVTIGTFSLTSGRNANEIVVRFNVRNTTENSKEISGRIFCVLKPKDTPPEKWVVIPKASIMKSGVPGPYNQGHYFSISRFKPVHFTINTKVPLEDFSDASVFIFDETEKLLLQTTFDTGNNKQN
nr:hypothetical protein [uncultured Desulfobacter sp.]